MSDKVIKIGGASGYWGDTALGPKQLISYGGVDYLILDYLAEIIRLGSAPSEGWPASGQGRCRPLPPRRPWSALESAIEARPRSRT